MPWKASDVKPSRYANLRRLANRLISSMKQFENCMLETSKAGKMEKVPFCLLFSFWKTAFRLNVVTMTSFR